MKGEVNPYLETTIVGGNEMKYDIILDGGKVDEKKTLDQVGKCLAQFFELAADAENKGVFNLDSVTFRVVRVKEGE